MGVCGSYCAPGGSAVETTPRSGVEIYGVIVSSNSLGAILIVTEKKIGVTVPTMPGLDGTERPGFLPMNPLHAIPTMKDGGLLLAESSAILRYLGTKYAPELYLERDAKRRGYIDWAMDSWAGKMREDFANLGYPCLGFCPHPKDRAAAAKTALDNLNEWAGFFLREKFVGGHSLSIADYKVAPFLVCYTHPMIREQCSFECPDRVKRYVKDFVDACPSSSLFSSAGGWSLKEYLDSRRGSPGDFQLTVKSDVTISTTDVLKGKAVGSGMPKIFGAAPSGNALGPTLMGMDLGCVELVPTMPGEATRTPKFLEMNPFHAIPTLKDGDYTLAESAAIMRYLAVTNDIELYPHDVAKRARIDWAIENFATGMYKDVAKTLYPCLGFAEFPSDRKEVGKALSQKLEEYSDFFLRDYVFIAGETLTIADYRVAPFFYAWEHPMLKERCSVEVPGRISQFNRDFAAECKGAKMLLSAGGQAIKEILDKAHTD